MSLEHSTRAVVWVRPYADISLGSKPSTVDNLRSGNFFSNTGKEGMIAGYTVEELNTELSLNYDVIMSFP